MGAADGMTEPRAKPKLPYRLEGSVSLALVLKSGEKGGSAAGHGHARNGGAHPIDSGIQ